MWLKMFWWKLLRLSPARRRRSKALAKGLQETLDMQMVRRMGYGTQIPIDNASSTS